MDELNRLSLTDEYRMKDKITPSPKGFVVIRDENGNIIFRGNNMVVKSGRSILFDLFTNNGNIKFSSLKAFIGNNSNMVGANDSYDTNNYTAITTGLVDITTDLDNNFNPQTTYYKKISSSTGPSSIAASMSDDFMISYTDNNCSTRLCPIPEPNDENKLFYYIDSDNLLIHMGIYYTPDPGSNSYSTFGLFYGSNGNKKLFSRIVFPKRTLTPNTPVIIDYYLYF